MESELILKAYIPSAMEYDKYFNKFRAFMNADLSLKAKEEVLIPTPPTREVERKLKNEYKNCWSKLGNMYWLRTFSTSTPLPMCGLYRGCRYMFSGDSKVAGLRVAMQLIYNPKNEVVLNCKERNRTTIVFGNEPVIDWKEKTKKWWERGESFEITSKAPIIVYGEKEYIWLNKEECEKDNDKTMICWSLELIERAEPIEDKDFGKSINLQKQCFRVVAENCTKEELNLLVPVRMSSVDGYDKAEPIF